MLALPSTSRVESADGIVLDALPYIDDVGYSDEYRQLAPKLIEAEMRRVPRTKNYLKNFPEPDYHKFLSPQLIELQQQMANKQDVPRLDLLRYEVPSPGRAVANKKAWLAAIDNCKAQLGNQALRKINLELLDEFGPEAYLRSNNQLKSQVEVEEAQLYKVRSQLYELNARRKRTQVEAGNKLAALGQSWVQLVTKNAGMEIAMDAMEAEIRGMAKKLKVDPALVQQKE